MSVQKLEVRISDGRILTTDVPDGTYILYKPRIVPRKMLKLIPASALSEEEDFLQYTPQTTEENNFLKTLIEAIQSKPKDFYVPICDPSLDMEQRGFHYEFGERPATGNSIDWWEDKIQEYGCNAHIGTVYERHLFLGWLVKLMLVHGLSKKQAYYLIAQNSAYIGHYKNSKNMQNNFEDTGSRDFLGFCDLANTAKIITNDSGYFISGGSFMDGGDTNSLAHRIHCYYLNDYEFFSVPWIVFNCSDVD